MRIAGEHIDIDFNVKRIDKDHIKITIKEDLADFDFLKDLSCNCWHFNIKSRNNDDLFCSEEANLCAASFILNLQDSKEWVLKCESFYKEIPFNFRGNNYYEELYFFGNGYEIVLRVAEECFSRIDWSPIRKHRSFYLEFFSDEKLITIMLTQEEKNQLFKLVKDEIEKDFLVCKKDEIEDERKYDNYRPVKHEFSDEYFFTDKIEKEHFIKNQKRFKRLFILEEEPFYKSFFKDSLFGLIYEFLTEEQRTNFHELQEKCINGCEIFGRYIDKKYFIKEKSKFFSEEEIKKCFSQLKSLDEKAMLVSIFLFGYDFYEINLALVEELLEIWKKDFLENNINYQRNKKLIFEYACIELFFGTLFAFKEEYIKAVYHFELALKTKTIFLYAKDVYRKLDYYVPVVSLVNKRGRNENPSKDRILNLCYSHYILSIYEKLNTYKDNAEFYNKKDIGFTKDNPAAVIGSDLRDFLEHYIFDNIVGENGNIIVNFSTIEEKLNGSICEYNVLLIDKNYKLTKANLFFYEKNLETRCFYKKQLKNVQEDKMYLRRIKNDKVYLPYSFNYKHFNEKALDVIFVTNKSILDEFVNCSICGMSLGFKPDRHICSDCEQNEFKRFEEQAIKECEKLFKNKDSSVHTFYLSKFGKTYEGMAMDKSKFKKDLFLGLIDWEGKTSHILFIPANSIDEEKFNKVYGDQSLCRMEFLEEPFLYDRINELDFLKFLVKTIKYKKNK